MNIELLVLMLLLIDYNVNARVLKENGKQKKLHRVLVSTIPNSDISHSNSPVIPRTRFQHRDLNAVRNFKKITEAFLRDRTRPWAFRRSTKKEELYLVPPHQIEEEVTAISVVNDASESSTKQRFVRKSLKKAQ